MESGSSSAGAGRRPAPPAIASKRTIGDPFSRARTDAVTTGVVEALEMAHALRSRYVAGMMSGTNAVIPDHNEQFRTPNPWDPSEGFNAMGTVRVDRHRVPDVDRVRREFPPVAEVVELQAYDYASDIQVVVSENETASGRARAGASRTAGSALKRIGLGSSDATLVFGSNSFEMKEAQVLGAFTKLGSALEHLVAGGTIAGPVVNTLEVVCCAMDYFTEGNDVGDRVPVVVPDRTPDDCLSALGYLLLFDEYRYFTADGRVAVRDAMAYPDGCRSLMFIFPGGNVRNVDVGGNALTVRGFRQLYDLFFDRGFGGTLNSAIYSGGLLNLAYGTPMLTGSDLGRIKVAEARSDFVGGVPPNRDLYENPVAGAANGGRYLSTRLGLDASRIVGRVMDAVMRGVANAAVGAHPPGTWLNGTVIPGGGVGNFQRFVVAGNAPRPGWEVIFELWRDVFLVDLLPYVGVAISDWAYVRGFLQVFRDPASNYAEIPGQGRPAAETHVPCRLMHGQHLTGGYTVPGFSAAEVSMLASNVVVGCESEGRQLWPRVAICDADVWDLRNRLLFRTEHSIFNLWACDYGLTPAHLLVNSSRFIGSYVLNRAMGTNVSVLPPVEHEAWADMGNFQHFEMAAYKTISPEAPLRGGSVAGTWEYSIEQSEVEFVDSAAGRRLMDSVVKAVYYDGGEVELPRAADAQYTIIKYDTVAGQAIFTGGSSFSYFSRGHALKRVILSATDPLSRSVLRRKQWDTGGGIRITST